MEVRAKGSTQSEQNEIRDKIIDGMNAVKNIATDGLLPGGGASLLHATQLLEDMEGENADETMGIRTLREALMEPFSAILENAGLNSKYFMSKVLDSGDWRKGVCAKNKQVADMLEAGVTLLDIRFIQKRAVLPKRRLLNGRIPPHDRMHNC